MSSRRSAGPAILTALSLAFLAGCSADGASEPGGSGGNSADASSGGNATGGSDGSGGSSGSGGSGGSSGSSGSGGAPADGGSDASTCKLSKPYSSSNATCNACAEAECCALVNACFSDPDCDDGYVNCILACALLPEDAGDAGIEPCLAVCATDHPKGKGEYDAAIGCAESKCSSCL